jgi:hypothetical protein
MLRMTNSPATTVNLPKSDGRNRRNRKESAAEDYSNAPGRYQLFSKQFQYKLPVGTPLDICTRIEVTTLEADTHDLDEGGQAIGEGPVRVQ